MECRRGKGHGGRGVHLQCGRDDTGEKQNKGDGTRKGGKNRLTALTEEMSHGESDWGSRANW